MAKKNSKPPPKEPQWTEGQHQVAILMEDMDSKFSMVIEKVQGMEERLIQRMDETDKKNQQEFTDIKSVLKLHGKILDDHSRKLDEHSKTLDSHGRKLDSLEGKLDKVIEKTEGHDKDIKELKTAVGAH